MLYRIIRYSVNEVAYNEGLISQDVGFVILREHCSGYYTVAVNPIFLYCISNSISEQ